MIDIFTRNYNKINNYNSKIFSLLRFIIRSSANILLPIHYTLTKYSDKYQIKDAKHFEKKIIVSLTSFPIRINKLWLVIETILRQTKKPDLIILWLSKDQFKDFNSIPNSLLKMQRRGLKIELVDGDLRSHKKYLYTLYKYTNDYLITIDDDLLYSKYLIEKLWNKHLKHQDAVICNYAYEIKKKGNLIDLYKNWNLIQSETNPSSKYFFGSGGGTLFPPGSFYEDVLNTEIFLKLCPNADDVWLNAMVKLNKKEICKINLYSTILPIQYFHNITLAKSNVIEGQNDEQIKNIQKYYIEKINVDPFES